MRVIQKLICVFIIYFLMNNLSESARILCVFQMPAVSHHQVFQPIWKELSVRGHEVVVVTPLPLKEPGK